MSDGLHDPFIPDVQPIRIMATEQKIGDPAENHRSISRNASRLHGWTIQKWIDYIRHREPECTLPGGVGGALVNYLVEPPPDGCAYVVCSTEMLSYDEWTKHPLFVKLEKQPNGTVEMTMRRADV